MNRDPSPPAPASSFPDQLLAYGRTPQFTKDNVPPALLKAHSTKEDVWGRIQVLEGELIYRIVDPRRGDHEAMLTPARPGVIEPGILHEVEPLGACRFFVEFLRHAPGPADAAQGIVR